MIRTLLVALLYAILGICPEARSSALPPVDQARVDALYAQVLSVPSDGWPGPSHELRFRRNGAEKLVVVHPHRQFDPHGLLGGQIDPWLSSQRWESFVVLEGLLRPYREVTLRRDACVKEAPGEPVNACLFRRYSEFDPSIDVELSGLYGADLSHAWAGNLAVSPDGFGPKERIAVVGGYFSNCHRNAVVGIARDFTRSRRGRTLEIVIPPSLTIDDSGALLPDGRRSARLLREQLDEQARPGGWGWSALGEWYLAQIEGGVLREVGDVIRPHMEFWVDGQRYATLDGDPERRVVVTIEELIAQ